MSDLKPCPFCGKESTHVETEYTDKEDKQFLLVCDSCGVRGPAEADGHDAISAWNFRPSSGEQRPVAFPSQDAIEIEREYLTDEQCKDLATKPVWTCPFCTVPLIGEGTSWRHIDNGCLIKSVELKNQADIGWWNLCCRVRYGRIKSPGVSQDAIMGAAHEIWRSYPDFWNPEQHDAVIRETYLILLKHLGPVKHE